MKNAAMHKSILAIALPAIISNITTPLLSLIDVAVVGHIGNAVYIGAIALGGAIFNLLYWMFGFLRMGSSGLTAQAYGAGDSCKINVILWRGMIIGLAAGVLMIILSVPLADTVLYFMADGGAAVAPARLYFLIAVWGAPAVLCNYAMSGWLLGMQNSRATLVVSLVTNVVNIFASLLLVYGFHAGIAGVAVGTMLAQWAGFVTSIMIIGKKYKWIRPQLMQIVNRMGLNEFFSINIFIFLRTICLIAVTMWFTHAGALLGTEILAANTLLMQLFMFFSYFMDGFAFAGEAVCGKWHGACDKVRLRKSVSAIFKWGVGVACMFVVVYFSVGEYVLHLLTDDASVVSCASEYLPWAVSVPLAGMSAFVWDGVFIGITRVKSMLSSVWWGAAVYFAIYFLFRDRMGNHALWLAFISYLVVRGVVLTIAYLRGGSYKISRAED